MCPNAFVNDFFLTEPLKKLGEKKSVEVVTRYNSPLNSMAKDRRKISPDEKMFTNFFWFKFLKKPHVHRFSRNLKCI